MPFCCRHRQRPREACGISQAMLTHRNKLPCSPKRVVLLGANGFVATKLREGLASAGIDCHAIGSSSIDLTTPKAAAALSLQMRRDDTVVMCSILTPDKGRDFHVFKRNLDMAHSVCLALESAPCAHFVYLSSDAVYDAHKVPLDEDSTREPVDLYALTHTAREMTLASVLARSGTPFCILRPTNIYGFGDTHNNYGPNSFVRSALQEGRISIFGRGEERRSHIYIDDAAALIIRAIQMQSEGTLNLAARPMVSFLHVANLVIENCGKDVRLDFLPRTIKAIHRPYKPTQVFRFIYNLGRRIGPIIHRTFDVSSTFKAFPDFQFTPLEKGLRTYLSMSRDAMTTHAAKA